MPRIKLTSLLTPFGGVSWQTEPGETEIARELIDFLEDRRVLQGRQGHAGTEVSSLSYQYALTSVKEIREELRRRLQMVRGDSFLNGAALLPFWR